MVVNIGGETNQGLITSTINHTRGRGGDQVVVKLVMVKPTGD